MLKENVSFHSTLSFRCLYQVEQTIKLKLDYFATKKQQFSSCYLLSISHYLKGNYKHPLDNFLEKIVFSTKMLFDTAQ